MIIPVGILFVLSLGFAIEFFAKPRWAKPLLHFAVTAAIAVAVFRSSIEAGGDVERAHNASLAADTLEFFEESTRSNTLAEMRVKVSVLRRELPKLIASGEPTTPALLKVLENDFSTNKAVEVHP